MLCLVLLIYLHVFPNGNGKKCITLFSTDPVYTRNHCFIPCLLNVVNNSSEFQVVKHLKN